MDRRHMLLATLSLFAVSVPGVLRAQTTSPDDKKSFSPEQLDQLLAPIALYPDALLSQVLMATSYPLEIVEAARWSKANPTLKGDAAVAAVKDQSWDVSVKSLVAFPSVLIQLNDHLDWTQKLGDAMISQEQDVAASIQRLRAKAADAGNLKSGQQQTVTTQGSGDDRTIVIEPANPDVVYVPSYNPSWAYGSWPYPASPPTYYPPPAGYGYGAALATGLLWGVGIAATTAMFSSWNWNNWNRGNAYVNVNVNRAVNIDNHFDRNRYVNNNRWQHDTTHRRGVAYHDAATRQRFNQHRPDAAQRQQFRGQIASHAQGRAAHPNVPHNVPHNLPQRQAGQHPHIQNQGRFAHGDRPTALSGVNRGHQVNREAARGRIQQGRAASHPNFQRPAGGGFHGGARGHRR